MRVLQNFFDKKEFDYNNNSGKIHFIDCYKKCNDSRKYLSCITVQTSSGMDIYVYDKNEGRYSKVDLLRFAKAIKNGLILYNGKVQGLRKVLKK